MGLYRLAVTGESFTNDDGTDRQDEIRRCKPREMVTLTHDTTNKFDPQAVAVISARGVQIGFLAKADVWAKDRIINGRWLAACIVHINQQPNGMRGIVLGVSTASNEDPWDITKEPWFDAPRGGMPASTPATRPSGWRATSLAIARWFRGGSAQ